MIRTINAPRHLSVLPRRVTRQRAYQVEKWDEEANGKLTPKTLRQYFGSQGYSVGDKVYDVGFSFPRHKHDGRTIVINLGGAQYIVDFDDERVVVGPGEYIRFPKGVYHEEKAEDGMHFGIATKEPWLAVVVQVGLMAERIAAFFKELGQKSEDT